ncbi:MAG: signal peptidase I [Planctomycetes bacterium]|nr:signal peptidase I [Planctomycetota bacterium]
MNELVLRFVKLGVGFVFAWVLLYAWTSCGFRKIPGGEMAPTLKAESFKWLLLDERTPERLRPGDVVLFEYPVVGVPQTTFAGRVMALPGDRVKMVSGSCYVNGEQTDASLLNAASKTDETLEEIVVPRDCVFILMDNRKVGAKFDSRAHGPIGAGAIIAKIKI